VSTNYEKEIIAAFGAATASIPGMGGVNFKGDFMSQPLSNMQYPGVFLTGWRSSRKDDKPDIITTLSMNLLLVVKDMENIAAAISDFKYKIWTKFSNNAVLGKPYVIDITLDDYNMGLSDESMFSPPIGMANMNITVLYVGTWGDL